MVKVQAIDDLTTRGTPVPVERVRAELQGALQTSFGTHLETRAQSMASRLLALMDGEDESSDEERLAMVVQAGWEAFIAGDHVEADRAHAQFARETGFTPWQAIVDRDDERQREESAE
jgi:hypothetical protein